MLYNNQTDITKLIKCIGFAADKHINQRRKNKSSDPYINHPIELMNILAECDITDLDILDAAILHDTIEDTDTTYDELVENFGLDIANIVIECTDDKSLDKITRKKYQITHGVFGAEKLDCLLKDFFHQNNITQDNLDEKLENYYDELKN